MLSSDEVENFQKLISNMSPADWRGDKGTEVIIKQLIEITREDRNEREIRLSSDQKLSKEDKNKLEEFEKYHESLMKRMDEETKDMSSEEVVREISRGVSKLEGLSNEEVDKTIEESVGKFVNPKESVSEKTIPQWILDAPQEYKICIPNANAKCNKINLKERESCWNCGSENFSELKKEDLSRIKTMCEKWDKGIDIFLWT